MNERDHWLNVQTDPDWKRAHIHGTGISLYETVDAVTCALPTNPGSVLEIGCGYGRLLSEMARIYPDAVLSGVDVNPASLAEVDCALAYCTDTLVGLPNQDAVYSVAVFQHLTDSEKQTYIREAYDLLNEGGVLRVQFIEGVKDDWLEHWVSAEQMVLWAHDTGYTSTRVSRGLAHPQWTWITCVK